MKKIIVFSVIFSLFGASVAFGAIQIKAIKWHDFMAQIETQNSGNVFIYKVEDTANTCYVMANDYSVNARTNGANFGISCVAKPLK